MTAIARHSSSVAAAAAAADTPPPLTVDADRLSAPAFRIFSRIAALWGLSTSEQCVLLGGLPESTFYKYAKTPDRVRLSRDTLDRISHIVGIYKALNVLLSRPEAADSWVRRANSAPLFAGRSALDYMLAGGFDDIAAVRHYVDGMRGA